MTSPRRVSERRRAVLLGTAGVLSVFTLGEIIPRSGLVSEQYFPPTSVVLIALVERMTQGSFWNSVGLTLATWGTGLVLATSLALVAGIIIGSSTFLRRATASTVEFLRPIPSVALIPLAILLFGVRMESALLLVVYAAFWQVLIQVLYGVADVDPLALQTARSFGLGLRARTRWVVLPTTLPYLFTGIRLAATVALILTVTAGLVIGTPGIGRDIALAQSGGAVPAMYALVLTTGVLGVGVNLAARAVERSALSWHASVRSEVPA